MGEPLRICLVSASGQNAFFDEILDAFGAALSEHGLQVEQSIDCFPPPQDDLVCLYVPHEFYPMVHELAHPSTAQLQRSVAISTEQPGTQWFDLTCGVAAHAGGVVDINALGLKELKRRGVSAAHAPLGYVAAWDAWSGRENGERPIDLAFLGGHTRRRAYTLAKCADAMAGRRAAIHLTETVQPHTVDSPHFLSGTRKWALMADSKVLLNVHRTELAYMEWHRVLGAILNGCVVLSERSKGIEPLVPGEHFVSARYDDLPSVLQALLAEPERLRQIRHAAYDLVRETMPVESTVEGLLQEVARAAGNPVARPRRNASPVAMPMPPPERKPEWEVYGEQTGEALPLRVALKQLVIGMKDMERRLDALTTGADTESVTTESLGPTLEKPRVSVLLTVYNYADYVGEALRSVALGDMPDVEVVAVDDASTDDSVAAVRDACASLPWLPVTFVRRGVNSGLPAARNLAAEHARADLLFVLDADNAVLPQGLRKLATTLDEAPQASFAYGLLEAFDMGGPTDLMNWHHWDPRRLRHGNFVDAMAMIRRSALQHVGGYTTDSAASGWEDFALWVAMADAGLEGIRVPDFIGRYRIGLHSMISISNIDTTAAWGALLRRHPVLTQANREPESSL